MQNSKLMSNKFKIISLIIIVSIIVGIRIYYNQKTERRYQACREKYTAESQQLKYKTGLGRLYTPQFQACIAGCKEKYGK